MIFRAFLAADSKLIPIFVAERATMKAFLADSTSSEEPDKDLYNL